jgi:hypothetical protein
MFRSKVYLKVDRVDAQTCALARTVSVADLHEALGGVAGRLGMMSPAMRPLIAGLRIAGPAVTAAPLRTSGRRRRRRSARRRSTISSSLIRR